MKRNIFNNCWLLAFGCWLTISFTSCEKAPLTNGKPVTETRVFEDNINALFVYDDIDVTLIESDEFKIEITTGENLMPKITSNVINDALYLRNENIRQWARSYNYPLDIKVYHNSITHINYMSWGDLKSEGYISQDTLKKFDLIVEHGSGHIDLKLNCDSLRILSNDGTAKINVAGSSDYSYIYHNARNDIITLGLVSKDACAEVYYEGSIIVNCTNRLDALVDDFGSIYYNGDVKELNDSITYSPVPNTRGVIEPYGNSHFCDTF